MKKSAVLTYTALTFFLVGALSMLFMSLHYFQFDVTGVMKGKPVAHELWYGLALRSHIIFGIIAILIGPFQFVYAIRHRNLGLHRTIGYLYAFSVMVSGISGFAVAQFPMGGIISKLGFSTLAIFWLFSLFRSLRAIRLKKIEKHRKWMFINYGLTFAAIPQRTLLLLPDALNIDFMNIYRLSAWLPWILTTLLAIWLHRK